MSEDHNYKIQLTVEDGRTFFWHKFGQLHLLNPELAEIWVKNFKPSIFEVTAKGELVAKGRSPEPSFHIVKVEKFPVDSHV